MPKPDGLQGHRLFIVCLDDKGPVGSAGAKFWFPRRRYEGFSAGHDTCPGRKRDTKEEDQIYGDGRVGYVCRIELDMNIF